MGSPKKKKKDTGRKSAVLDAVNKVFREALTCETDAEVGARCLEVAQELTSSAFGFIGEVNEEGRFDTIALSNPGWDACKMPRSNAALLITGMEIRGIWGRVIKDGKSLITNDPSSHADSVGIPEGHPRLTSFIGVPLRRGGETFGMIALANKGSGYKKRDQEDLEALSGSFVEALMRKRAEKGLKEALEDLEERVEERTRELNIKTERFMTILESVPEILYIIDPETYEIIFVNKAFMEMLGKDPVGKICYEEFQGFTEPCRFCTNEIILKKKGEPYVWEHYNPVARKTLLCNDRIIKWPDGRDVKFEMAVDITDTKRMEEEITRQAQEILDISTPVVKVWEGVVAAPLIGTLDSQRTQNFMERLLGTIVETRSPVALVDITGVPAMDTQTAQHLIEAVSAVRLLGSEVILTGVRPAIAQTLVHLGVDLGEVITRPSMAAGFKVALNMLGYGIVGKDKQAER